MVQPRGVKEVIRKKKTAYSYKNLCANKSMGNIHKYNNLENKKKANTKSYGR